MDLIAFFATVCNLILSFLLFGKIIIKLPLYQKRMLTSGLSFGQITIAAWLFYLFDDSKLLLLSGLSISLIGGLIFLIVSSWFFIKKKPY